MASTSEVGHAKNVANFQDLIEFISSYGATYNPTKEALKLPKLITLKDKADLTLLEVVTQNTNYNNKVNDRMIAFNDVRTLSTRLFNALQASDATAETIKDAKTFNRKMQGKRASTSQEPVDPDAPAPKTISTSQQSYDQLIQHLIGLKSVLETEPSYTPNEVDLQIANIDAKIADLTSKNTIVATAYAGVSNSRIARNKILYAENSGLVNIAFAVKKYVKSVFGASSPEYAQVSGLKFKIVKS